MALEGKFIWKGIEISNAYITIQQANCSVAWDKSQVLKTEAKYNEDGTIKSEAVYEEKIDKILNGNYTANVYKDKASKEAKPEEKIESIYGSYDPKHTASAKNDVAQAYEGLKAMDAYKDLADA